MTDFTTIIVGAVVLLALLLAAVFVYRSSNRRMKTRAGQRLGITEFHVMDNTRRLVLVRRDDVEHLLLIGGGQDLVIESRIGSGYYAGAEPVRPATAVATAPATAAPPASAPVREDPVIAAPAPVPDSPRPAPRPAPRPSVFGDRRPVGLRPADPPMTRRPPGE